MAELLELEVKKQFFCALKIQKGDDANFGPKHSKFVVYIGSFLNNKKFNFFLAQFSRIELPFLDTNNSKFTILQLR